MIPPSIQTTDIPHCVGTINPQTVSTGAHQPDSGYYFSIDVKEAGLFRGCPLEGSYISSSVLALLTRISNLLKESDNQMDKEAEHPNSIAVSRSLTLVRQLGYWELLPSRISPSVEGGVVLGFRKNGHYAGIEVSNDGEVIGLTTDYAGKINVWDVDLNALKGTIDRVSEHLNA